MLYQILRSPGLLGLLYMLRLDYLKQTSALKIQVLSNIRLWFKHFDQGKAYFSTWIKSFRDIPIEHLREKLKNQRKKQKPNYSLRVTLRDDS